MGPIWDLFKAALGLAVDVSRNMVTAYLKFLKRLAKWSIIVALVLLPFPIIGSLVHFSWMSGIYLAVIGLLITIWLVAAFPIVMLMRYGYEEIKSIKKTAQLIGGNTVLDSSIIHLLLSHSRLELPIGNTAGFHYVHYSRTGIYAIWNWNKSETCYWCGIYNFLSHNYQFLYADISLGGKHVRRMA